MRDSYGVQICPACGQENPDGFRLCGMCGASLAAEVARSTDWVVTHGEPHAGNVLRTGETYVLVDWDTVALAPPERDLWMLADEGAEMTAYANATGHEPDQAGIDFFRLRWDLSDIAAFTDVLRAPHRHTADTQRAYDGLTHYRTKHAR